jgi:hypothetical protein
LEEQKTKLTNSELDFSEEEKTTQTILENIEKDGYDEKKYKPILKKQLKILKKNSKKRQKELIAANNNLDRRKSEFNELKTYVNSKDLILSDKIKEISKSLQNFILKINTISLIGIDENLLLKSFIDDLTSSIQKLINELESEENVNRSNIIKLLEIGNLKETMNIMSKIEEKFNEQ